MRSLSFYLPLINYEHFVIFPGGGVKEIPQEIWAVFGRGIFSGEVLIHLFSQGVAVALSCGL
jgi:hypothetical protein